MSKPAFLDDFQQKLADFMRNSPVADVDRNLRAALTQGLSKLDVVTREEFDVQADILARTRAKVAELEARIAALEAARDAPTTPAA